MATTPLPPRTSSMPSTPSGPVPERVLSPTRTPNNAAADARRAARREQLRDFYGLKRDGASSPGPGSAPATPGGGSNGNGGGARRKQRRGGDGALDLTSPNFSPSEYYEDLIAKATLAELMGSTSVLAADVGRLHSSRHTLVYNHHHQLFSAGDTIAQLNTRTPQLLSIVTSLQERFSDISQLADSVALTEKAPLADGDRARAAAAQGLERVRLMVLAGDGPDAVTAAWERVEAEIKGYGDVEGIDGILAEGREVVDVSAAK
ncbi:Vacuolar protein sorting-associated protein 51 [Vanrija pseudolonga]|uniref:Vacuolar protein sorting-associated protein 51 homolog n=1 Tax=Vanrija pseudolonga TaxID=143232 RepID=A0AAF0YCI3_9TREE|nr:Vacuolar protein sorting-associated protein 51 [Vanrija pseudolonga]